VTSTCTAGTSKTFPRQKSFEHGNKSSLDEQSSRLLSPVFLLKIHVSGQAACLNGRTWLRALF